MYKSTRLVSTHIPSSPKPPAQPLQTHLVSSPTATTLDQSRPATHTVNNILASVKK